MSTIVYEDNRGAIFLANSSGYRSRTRHINVRYHFIREHILNDIIKLIAIDTKRQLANAFTKALPAPAFISNREQYNGMIKLGASYYTGEEEQG